MNENEFILEDRIAKIQAINSQLDLEHNSYISFSGGKDSCVLSTLIDIALPNNNIPRVYLNTGIEYLDIVKYVREREREDKRFIIVNQTKNIRKTLQEYGYPFKSKQHSHNVAIYQTSGMTITNEKYLGISDGKLSMFQCPETLKYQFTNDFKLKVSDKCCYKLKKELAHNWQKQNNKTVTITGMRSDEGGSRNGLTCLTNNDTKFHPLVVCSDEWEEWFINTYNIKLCELYYPPYNFKRTGCKGCPFALTLQEQLLTMKKLLPNEYKQCLLLWKPVYDEYVRLGYRLDKDFYDKKIQMTLDLGDV